VLEERGEAVKPVTIRGAVKAKMSHWGAETWFVCHQVVVEPSKALAGTQDSKPVRTEEAVAVPCWKLTTGFTQVTGGWVGLGVAIAVGMEGSMHERMDASPMHEYEFWLVMYQRTALYGPAGADSARKP